MQTQPSIEPTGSSDEAIRTVVARLARRHPSGGKVIERAAILAEGASSAAILTWIVEHEWEPEEQGAAVPGRDSLGLHGARDQPRSQAPRRYVLAPGTQI
jgi:hypothetical protein